MFIFLIAVDPRTKFESDIEYLGDNLTPELREILR